MDFTCHSMDKVDGRNANVAFVKSFLQQSMSTNSFKINENDWKCNFLILTIDNFSICYFHSFLMGYKEPEPFIRLTYHPFIVNWA